MGLLQCLLALIPVSAIFDLGEGLSYGKKLAGQLCSRRIRLPAMGALEVCGLVRREIDQRGSAGGVAFLSVTLAADWTAM